MFVVGAEMTSRHAVQRAPEQLELARAKFIGAVLNRVDLQHNAYYMAGDAKASETVKQQIDVRDDHGPPRACAPPGRRPPPARRRAC